MTDRTGSINRFGSEGRYHWTGGLGQGRDRERAWDRGTERHRPVPRSISHKKSLYFVSLLWMLKIALALT